LLSHFRLSRKGVSSATSASGSTGAAGAAEVGAAPLSVRNPRR
jgi:hypothetical protein